MARGGRTRAVTAGQARRYLAKAEEYADAASSELDAGRGIAATSLAIHAAINAADTVCGVRLGERTAGPDYDQVLALLKKAGKGGAEVGKDLRRLPLMKTKAEYDPDDIPLSMASRAVARGQKCVTVARRVVASLR